jgi:hypothetical protein
MDRQPPPPPRSRRFRPAQCGGRRWRPGTAAPAARLRQAVRPHHWTVGVKFTEPLPRPSVPRVPASAWRTEGKVKASSAREMRLTKARMRQSSRQGRRFRHGHLQGSDTRTDANYSPVACDVTSRGFASAAATQSPALKLACAIPGGAAPRADDLCSRLRGRASRCGGWGSSVHASEPVPTPSRCPRPGCPHLPSGIVRRAGAGSQRRHTGAFARRECASERATRVTLACARRAPGRGRVLRAEPRAADAHSRRPPPSSPIGFSGAPRTHGTMAQPGVCVRDRCAKQRPDVPHISMRSRWHGPARGAGPCRSASGL